MKFAILKTFLMGCALSLISCESFLEVKSPSSKIPSNLVFTDDLMAESALAGIYLDLYSSVSFAGGGPQGIVSIAGLTADELRNNKNEASFLEFQNNSINSYNPYIASLWRSMYKAVYEANSAIEGISNSTTLSNSIRRRLKGEALFVRAFCYFYLTNLFGNVPLALSTDYNTNAYLTRAPSTDIYKQIIKDLSEAESILQEEYTGTDRIRPNRFAATALLARAYLFTQDWSRAEDKASNIIAKTSVYELGSTPSSVFLLASKEAIWQLRPNDVATYTYEGYYFGVVAGPQYNVLREDILMNFEENDLRITTWIKKLTAGANTTLLPDKYKKYSLTGTLTEYSMVMRLAEVYLIRAEARVNQAKLTQAILDIDVIRSRAGLRPINEIYSDLTQDELLHVIENERKIEFLVEWGHRWLDLKRWGRAESVLRNLKNGWSVTDLIYPVPSSELSKNSNLEPQNQGY